MWSTFIAATKVIDISAIGCEDSALFFGLSKAFDTVDHRNSTGLHSWAGIIHLIHKWYLCKYHHTIVHQYAGPALSLV